MVSDTPSQPPEDENREKHAKQSSTPNFDALAASDSSAATVETAMADVAAAIKRHDGHSSDDTSNLHDDHNQEGTNTSPVVEEPLEPVDTSAGLTETTSSTDPQPPSKSTGIAAIFGAGVIGGVITLAGIAAVQYFGLLAIFPANPNASLVGSKVATLQQQVDALKANAPTTDAISQLRTDLADLQTKISGFSASSGQPIGENDTLAALKQQVETLQNTLKSDTSQIQSLTQSNKSISSDQQQLQQKLAVLEMKANTPGKDLAVARAIAAAGLKSAIDRGGSFASELTTYTGIAQKGSDLKQLQSFAATGIPTRKELAVQFSGMADAIIKASNQPSVDETIFQRLVNSAKDLVSVRPVGNVEGKGTPAIVARIENNVNAGHLTAAAQEWDTLPETGKQISADFGTALKARIKTDDLVTETLSNALKSTAGHIGSENVIKATPAN